MTYKIIPKYGHCEVYIDEEFYCSADDWNEAERETEKYEEEHTCVLI